MTHASRALQSHDLWGEIINIGSHTYFLDHTRTWRASADEWSAQYRGHLRDNMNIKVYQRKNAPIGAQKRVICLKQKYWSKRWVLVTSNRCPDHLSRQYLTSVTTFPYRSKNFSAEHIHALPTLVIITNTLTYIDTHTHTHTLTHTLTSTNTHTHTHRQTHTLTNPHTHTHIYLYIHTLIPQPNKFSLY